jgi:hypothetical protein
LRLRARQSPEWGHSRPVRMTFCCIMSVAKNSWSELAHYSDPVLHGDSWPPNNWLMK